MKNRSLFLILFTFFFFGLFSSQTIKAQVTTDDSKKLKKSFFSWPSQKRFKKSLLASSKMSQFQIPMILGLSGLILFDGNASKVIGETTPFFKSQKRAGDVSDALLLSLIPAMIWTSNFTTVHNDNTYSSSVNRWKLYAMQTLIIATDFTFVHAIKTSTNRIRPDESDSLSFPSGHSSVSAGLSRVIYNNIENSKLAGTFKGRAIQLGAITTSAVVAYARVEAKKHHLSDIFIGHAIGAFISDFLYNSFLEYEVDINPHFSLNSRDVSLGVVASF